MVDPDTVRRLLDALREYRERLEQLRDLPLDTYLDRERFAGRYLLQAAAQACIDIANHLISSEGWRVPRDFRDAFSVLEENDVIDTDLGGRLRALAGLRNRLVHLYEKVDDRLVYEGLAAGLADVDAYARTVARLVEASD